MRPRLRSSLILILFIAASLVMVVYFRYHLNTIDQWILRIGIFGPVLIIVLYSLLSLTPIPTDPLTVFVGAFYGPLAGLVISSLGNSSASLVEYFVSHHISNATHFERLKSKLPWGLGNLPVDSIWFLTLGRMVPGFGSKMVSLLSGLYHVPLKRYLWTTFISNLVGSVLWIVAGYLLVRS